MASEGGPHASPYLRDGLARSSHRRHPPRHPSAAPGIKFCGLGRLQLQVHL